ncbi:MAG: HEAT repeat domain-containing protein [Chloroflexi bacterium]|nr:HEAT repeat domain-containing protein [Chloroflexota bacterium]
MHPTLATLLHQSNYPAITRRAEKDKRVLSELIALTLNEDDLIGWRAVKALGQASAVIAARDAEFVRGILRRLQWSLNDESGSIGWRAPQAMGAILAATPSAFAEFAPIIASTLHVDETHFYPGVLWAIGVIAEDHGARVQFALPQIRALLRDASPETRGMAAFCLGRLRDAASRDALAQLVEDDAQLRVFEEDELRARSVGELARQARARIEN